MPVITYPGVTGVISCEVTTSVGITPATIQLLVSPSSTPATTGNLAIGDGVNGNITFPNCMCVEPRAELSASAAHIFLRLQDRRWKWRYGYPVSGHYNMEAGSGKLVPWSVRSPWQLAYLLLTAMGELTSPSTQIDLPGGLAQPGLAMGMGPNDRAISASGQYLGMGQNYALTQSNPETRWIARPAALCLADLAEAYGRIVVLDPVSNTVYLKQPGVGTALPATGIIRTGVATQQDAIPSTVTIMGSPIEFQTRLRLRAVGREFDRSWKPINDLSYAPFAAGQKMIVNQYFKVFKPFVTYVLIINGVTFSIDASGVADGPTLIGMFVSQINASTDTRIAGLLTAASITVPSTVSIGGSALQLTGANNGYEFEVLTTGTVNTGTSTVQTDWVTACIQYPVRGSYNTNDSWLVVFPDPQPLGSSLRVTVTLAGAAPYIVTTTATGLNGIADALDRLASAINSAALGYTAAAGGRNLTVTCNSVGVAITVTAVSVGGAAPTVTEIVTTTAPATGWEPYPPEGRQYAAIVPTSGPANGMLNKTEAGRLAQETVYTCYQVVCESPANGTIKSIPMPFISNVTNQFNLLLQPDSPTPITPQPGNVNVLDPRTQQPFAQTTYNGYAVRRPNLVYGSVDIGILSRAFLLWRGGTYLTYNTAPRLLLPLTFSIVDPEMQVIQFSEPLYRRLGLPPENQVMPGNGVGYLPAEIVIECGVLALDPNTYSPLAYQSTPLAVTGGFGPPLVTVRPDIRQEYIGLYDAYHNLTGYTTLDQDAAIRAAYAAAGVAMTFQAPTGLSAELPGILSIPLDGLTRQIKWQIRDGENGITTSVDQNCETSRVVLPYPKRRMAEGLPPDATRRQQNIDSDWLFRAAQSRFKNAMGAVLGFFSGGGR